MIKAILSGKGLDIYSIKERNNIPNTLYINAKKTQLYTYDFTAYVSTNMLNKSLLFMNVMPGIVSFY
jgi:hypothetical protein